jgi:CheY-like chemotaxis protein
MPPLHSVLLVDDDPTTNFLNKLLLTTMQVSEQLFVAENGEQALRALTQHCTPMAATCPQLILLDMNMPVLNGLAFLEVFAQLPLAQEQPIIIVMLTSSLHPRDLLRVQELPVAGFLDKPLTKEKVTALLAEHFPTTPA